MSPRSEFQRSLDQADARLKRTAQLLARTRRLADSGNIPEAFNMAFTFAAEAACPVDPRLYRASTGSTLV